MTPVTPTDPPAGGAAANKTSALSPRLEAVATLVPQGGVVAELCADHANLALALVENGRRRAAIAVDIADDPLGVARANVARSPLSERLEVRQGDGFAPIAPGEADCAIIAGVGGALITRLVQRGHPERKGINTLVLQPNKGAPVLREWLADNGWSIEDEAIVEDNGRIYVAMRAELGHADLDRADILLGPVLRRRGGPTFDAYVEQTLEWMSDELEAMMAADVDETVMDARQHDIEAIRAAVEELAESS